MSITIDALFCDVDNINKQFYPEWERMLLESGEKKRRKPGTMSASEIMTIIINFHQSYYKDFKNYYLHHVHRYMRKEFPKLLNYTRFLEVIPSVLVPLCAYFTHCKGKPALPLLIPPASKFVATSEYFDIRYLKVWPNGASRPWGGSMALSYT